jgi:tetratricopeptide (TPR) repeat protein
LITLKHKHAKLLRVALCFCVLVAWSNLAYAQTVNEGDALAAIKLATNPTTKLAAAEDFIAHFPKSSARLSIAELIAAELLKIKNGAVALALYERAQAVFTNDDERKVLRPVALAAYTLGNRTDDAFALAGEMLAKDENDLPVLVKMTQLGAEEARKRNRKYADVSLQYGLKAISLIEADKRLGTDADLAQLYQQTAILHLSGGNNDEALSRLRKAMALSPRDPSNFALLGRVLSADYVTLKTKQDVGGVLDQMVDAYARAAGLAMGRPEYQGLLQQIMPELTTYYKERHGSVKGLRELILSRR